MVGYGSKRSKGARQIQSMILKKVILYLYESGELAWGQNLRAVLHAPDQAAPSTSP